MRLQAQPGLNPVLQFEEWTPLNSAGGQGSYENRPVVFRVKAGVEQDDHPAVGLASNEPPETLPQA